MIQTFHSVFTRLHSRRVVMCLVVVTFVRSFLPSYNCGCLTYFDQTWNIESRKYREGSRLYYIEPQANFELIIISGSEGPTGSNFGWPHSSIPGVAVLFCSLAPHDGYYRWRTKYKKHFENNRKTLLNFKNHVKAPKLFTFLENLKTLKQ